MSPFQIDLRIAETAYMFGFLQADGHLYANTRNRGKLTLELKAQDMWLLEQFARLVPFYSSIKTRTRRTNFSEQHTSVVWSVHSRDFRDALVQRGFTVGRKSEVICIPEGEFAKTDYFRGIVDADGSLGITAQGFPYVSLITASENLALGFADFIYETTGSRKVIGRNQRDGVFNISVFKEVSQILASRLYYPNCLALPRKAAKVPEIIAWQRPPDMIRKVYRAWDAEQDQFLLTHSLEEAIRHLRRTEKSVKTRLWRLVGKKVTD